MTEYRNRVSQVDLADVVRLATEIEGARIEQISDEAAEQVDGGQQPQIGVTMGYFPTESDGY